jgi:aspartyl-tRNA synthetase
MTFIDLRDRYGLTQLAFNMEKNAGLCDEARKLGREDVIRVSGKVMERQSKNKNMATGDIELEVSAIDVLHDAHTPPFTIEEQSDGGEELRMKYRYLDLRRSPLQKNIQLRHNVAQAARAYMNDQQFLEIETPFLIKSTPEGARDFVVPSRMNQGEFYALPQSPQTFKQLLMVSGFDRYFQIVKCFRDEDLRADRQPEFTQIDCEMAFVDRGDIMRVFEGLVKHLFKAVKNIDLPDFPVMSYDDAMSRYGCDKPDIRFGMEFVEIDDIVKGKGFNVFDQSEIVAGIKAEGCGEYSRKQLDELVEFVKKPQVGGKGLVYVKCSEDGSFKSSVDKFYDQSELSKWAAAFNAKAGDLLLIVSGDMNKSRSVLNEVRLEMGKRLGLRDNTIFKPLWVVDFPLLEWDEESKRFFAMHHPFTSPNPESLMLIDNEPGKAKANAYDLVINGVEIGGGSIRIHDSELQQKMFRILGFTDQEAKSQFGFLMNAFNYGAPPHGGIAFGFDRLCAIFGGSDSIRDYIAFPKNNSGRDVMLDAPSVIAKEQLDELGINLNVKNHE